MIIAKDRQTVVIGGLIRDKVSYNVSKVPILGDIPFIGSLFRYRTKNLEKRNLLIFLTPYIIRELEDFRRIFRQKMRERQEFISLYQLRSHPFKWWESFDPSRAHGFVDLLLQRVEEGIREGERIKKLKLMEERTKSNQKSSAESSLRKDTIKDKKTNKKKKKRNNLSDN